MKHGSIGDSYPDKAQPLELLKHCNIESEMRPYYVDINKCVEMYTHVYFCSDTFKIRTVSKMTTAHYFLVTFVPVKFYRIE